MEKIGEEKSGGGKTGKKGLALHWLTPLIYWLPSADSNHGPDG